MDHKKVQVGDLIVLGSAPITKWYLSWLIDIKVGASMFENQYLCESIETGELMWWHNICISFIERELVADQPQWRWTDRQFAFNDRWEKVCRKDCAAYIVLPTGPIFGDGFEVTLGTRTRHQFDDYRGTKTFDDWRKVTKTMMAEFYNECVTARKKAQAAQKQARKSQ